MRVVWVGLRGCLNIGDAPDDLSRERLLFPPGDRLQSLDAGPGQSFLLLFMSIVICCVT